ncbi:hypothetical protein BIY21_02050 [Vibrio ponticus]|uniref:DUF4336 domain-containing protein n=1 Tax=Vibrio ponticus TaxID=265668 RepID=A0ABX3FHP8_9VIBR|nr:DUF4336 domain-containing protein [Vibrio ponticus]OLQ90817.1 hypothetical protein BIY21_02050 [Vibrio ponticus]
MIEIQPNLWIFNGGNVSFLSFPFSTRMTVVRLAGGDLWLHSPIELNEEVRQQVDSLGTVRYLIAPNSLHHLFIKQWQEAYPQAFTYGTAQVVNKRQDLTFENCLAQSAIFPWQEEIEHLLFTGSSVMEESIFLHKHSQTLIVTDLIENFDPQHFKPLQRNIAKAIGILAPEGKMPLDWRITFMFNKPLAREHLAQIIAWQPERIILAHGKIIESNAVAFLQRSFGWLGAIEASNV